METILITGGTGGLGQTLLPRLVELNYNFVSISKKGNESFEAKIKESIALSPTDNNIKFIHQDLSLTQDFETLVNYREIDHAVLMHAHNFICPILDLPLETLMQSLMINFISTFAVARECIKVWKNDKGSNHSLTFISSVAVKGGSPDEVAYHASKRAMEAAMLSFAREFSRFNIRSNVIAPGIMDTPMGKEALKKRPDILSRIPNKSFTKTSDVVNAILFCINTTSLTGESININQGRYLEI